ncbi:hypothetical protein KHA80_21130 [Anaerobacillus sp. HL2]|nr:hypothetical protein KHA80_21130 [Anaerobacillus sp. HL2]
MKNNETLTMIMLTNWKADRRWDPFCGSGTLPTIEAAMIESNIAPGFNRILLLKVGWVGDHNWQQAME